MKPTTALAILCISPFILYHSVKLCVIAYYNAKDYCKKRNEKKH